MLHPSPALVVLADTPISECVRTMKAHDVGSLLVVSDDGQQELVGIFTERDLLRKFDQIIDRRNWERPVRTVMTRPVRTLELSRIEEAAATLARYNFRHLPVVTKDRDGKVRISGVISMRDLFRQAFAIEADPEAGADLLGIVSRDEHLVRTLRSLSRTMADPRARRLLPDLDALFKDPAYAAKQFSLVVVDLDGLTPKDWSTALRRINREPSAPAAMILYNPLLHPASTIRVIEQLSRSKRFQVFAKPVNISALAANYFPDPRS